MNRILIALQTAGAFRMLKRRIGHTGDPFVTEFQQMFDGDARGVDVIDINAGKSAAGKLPPEHNRKVMRAQFQNLGVVEARTCQDHAIDVSFANQSDIGIGLADIFDHFDQQAKARRGRDRGNPVDHTGQEGIRAQTIRADT